MQVLNPAHSEETVQRARMLIDEQLHEEALTWLIESLQTEPNQRLVWHFLFETLAPKGDIAPILSTIQDVIIFIEDPEDILLVMAQHMQLRGFHDEAVEIFNIIFHHQPSSRKTFEELLLHQHLNGFDDESAFAAYHEFNRRFAAPITAASTPAATEKIIDKPLNLGFVSRDFASGHSLKAAMAAFFARPAGRNDRYILYSSSPPEQQVEEFFRESADEFSNVFVLDDMELANRIRSDEIDVLFDFTGHMPGNRLMTYAEKPAPLILCWSGLGTSAGIEAVDYFIADDVYVPRETEKKYLENIIFFDGSSIIWCPPARMPDTVTAPCLSSELIRFCNLNRTVKLQRKTLELFASVLNVIPNSTMTFKDTMIDDWTIKRLSEPFISLGIAQDRIDFRGKTDHYGHLQTYNEVDIALDGFPQQGGITTIEALSMGIPVVSYNESIRPCARAGEWILKMVGVPAFSTSSKQSYVEIATELSKNRQRLDDFRQRLRPALLGSPLCNQSQFTYNIGKMLGEIWRRYCAGQKPQSFAIKDLT